jgi:paraquat-inducible protein B
MGKVDKLTGDLSKLTENVDGRVPEMMTSFTVAAKSAQKALDQAQQTLVSVDGFTNSNSPVRYEMTKALRELSEAARALRVLADYLEHYPNSVVFGRSDGGAK